MAASGDASAASQESPHRNSSESIKRRNGVTQALIIVPSPTDGAYFVVDGNVRLAGGQILGKECPLLKCDLVSASEGEQLLDMLITSEFRYDPDPVSQARHIRRMMTEIGFSIGDVVKQTGMHRKTIESRLRLLDLDEEIQSYIMEGRLPSDIRCTESFLSISNRRARVKLAERLARDGITVKAILKSCAKLAFRLEEQNREDYEGTPSVELSLKRSHKSVSLSKKTTWEGIRSATKQMCEACSVKQSLLESSPEPAWQLISHAAGESCEHCNVRGLKSACDQCPGVDLLRRIIDKIGDKASVSS